MSESDYLFGWSLCPGVGNVRMTEIMKQLGNAKFAWENWEQETGQLKWPDAFKTRISNFISKTEIKKLVEARDKQGIGYVSAFEDKFPHLLTNVDPVPLGLYWKGNWNNLDNNLLAVVGTRKITDYGKLVTRKLVNEMINQNLGVISGLMYGVDEMAHKTAWENNGINVGVWAGGLDSLNEGSRAACARNVVENGGLILSEYPLTMKPMAATFPARNRIVAGLSIGVLVVEGSEGSGTLITAGFAASLGKPVFAVPGPITSIQSTATMALIKQGAIPVAGIEDVLAELPNIRRQNVSKKHDLNLLSDSEKIIVKCLMEDDRSIDDLVRMTKLSAGEVAGCLSVMELKDIVLRNGVNWSVNR